MTSRLRIVDPFVKIGLVTAWLVLLMSAAIATSMLQEPVLVLWFGVAGVVALVVGTSRFFRLPDEREPRPWWQMTGHPVSGVVVGVLFGTSVLVSLVSGSASAVIGLIVELCISMAYLASSLTLWRRSVGARKRQRKPTG